MLKITLRAARVNSLLTVKQVAKHAKKSVDTITKYEKDSSNIPHDLLVILLDLYDVSINDIFFGKESDFIGMRKLKRIS